jgi:hypothetical protein
MVPVTYYTVAIYRFIQFFNLPCFVKCSKLLGLSPKPNKGLTWNGSDLRLGSSCTKQLVRTTLFSVCACACAGALAVRTSFAWCGQRAAHSVILMRIGRRRMSTSETGGTTASRLGSPRRLLTLDASSSPATRTPPKARQQGDAPRRTVRRGQGRPQEGFLSAPSYRPRADSHANERDTSLEYHPADQGDPAGSRQSSAPRPSSHATAAVAAGAPGASPALCPAQAHYDEQLTAHRDEILHLRVALKRQHADAMAEKVV